MLALLTIAAIFTYGLVTFGHLLPQAVPMWLQERLRAIASVGFGAHALSIAVGFTLSRTPGLDDALSSVALGVMGVYLWVGQDRMRAVGMLLGPLALVLLGTAQVLPDETVAALDSSGPSPWLPVHLGLMFSGLVGFALAFAVGVLYLVARHWLKTKQLSRVRRLPSLEVLDRLQFRAVLFGFVFLTLGIGAGGAWASASSLDQWAFDPKVFFTLVLWLWYGIALQVRLVAGWRGRWSALFSIVGFAGMIFSLLGINWLFSGWHGYGA